MKLTIGMMVKNEEHNLDRCLKSLQSLRAAIDSELVIVDTGSEDNTVAIAKQYTDKIYFHPWNNHFSDMRNITISYAKGEWFFVMDADEELVDATELINFLNSPSRDQYGAIAISCRSITNEATIEQAPEMVTFRLFKNDGYFHYEGAIHNQQVFQGKALLLPVHLLHYGYMSTDAELMERKFIRTSTILKNELEKDPANIYYWCQLSVSYSMHGDLAESIAPIETAYDLFVKKGKPAELMYVYTTAACIYHLNKNYEKLETICIESLSIKTGYIDIYYYLAEAQASLQKHELAIDNFLIYLDLLEHRDKCVKDSSIIEYTLGKKECAYYFLTTLYRKIQNYEQALIFAKKITHAKLIAEHLPNTIRLYLKQSDYKGLRQYYNRIINEVEQISTMFYESLETVKRDVPSFTWQFIAAEFQDLPNEYGLLNRMILSDYANQLLPNESTHQLKSLNFSDLPKHCHAFWYYALKYRYPLHEQINIFKELYTASIFDHLQKQYPDVGRVIFNYLHNTPTFTTYYSCRLGKMLSRCALVLASDLSNTEYLSLFAKYIAYGRQYLQNVYHPQVLSECILHDLKNDEEAFLLYMSYAADNQEINNRREYIRYMKLALQVSPLMKRGIQLLLDELENRKPTYSNEFVAYQQQVKQTIKTLISQNQIGAASKIISEYKTIVDQDLEILLFESEILLKETAPNMAIN